MIARTIARTFARQHGLVTREQALAARLTPQMIKCRLRSGQWVRVAPGVYRLTGVAVTWRQRALAACLDAGAGAVLSNRSAAVLLGVSGFRPGSLHITVSPGRSARSALATVHRSRVLPAERTRRDGIPVTHPARTLADLSRGTDPALLVEAVDDVLCRRLTTLDRLLRQPAPKLLGTILAAWTPGAMPDSVAEMQLARAVIEAGLGPPVHQYWIASAHARVDVALPPARIAFELDSFRWHGGRRPFDADRARGNRIVAAGWHLLRATPLDLESAVTAAAHLARRVA